MLEADLEAMCDESTYIRCQIDISRVAVHAWSGLADARVLVPNGDIVRSYSSLVVTRFLWQVQSVTSLVPLLLGNSMSLQSKRCERHRGD